MARRSLALACVLVIAYSCARPPGSRVDVETKLTAPRALLDRAARLEIRVLEGEVTCDESTGATKLPMGEAGAREIARRELGDTGCAAGARFCGEIPVEKSDAVRVFSATAKDASDATLAIGCAAAQVVDDALSLSIKMFRYLEPPTCGDGTIQPTEQCEPGGNALCDEQCQSNEVLLSLGNAQNNTDTGGPNDKSDPFFLWPAGTGTAGRFYAFFTDRRTGSANNTDVGLRAMGDDFAPLSSPLVLARASIFLPTGGAPPFEASPFRQSLPQAAALGGRTYVAFADDNSPSSFGLDVHLRSFDDALQSSAMLAVNGKTSPPEGEPAIQSTPSIAAGRGRLFVAWEDAATGRIAGRTLVPPATFGAQNDISTGNASAAPSVAATATGFVVAWKSGTGIRFRALNEEGTPQGTEEAVSEGGAGFDRPRVASLPDGRFAVTWSAGGDVFVQRFDDRGAKVPGDQARPINDVVHDGEQIAPVIAATPAAGGSYVVAWVDAASGHVRARFLGGSGGFLFNNVNGQATEFQASRVDGRTRTTPAVAVGGSGPFIAIGWEDESTPSAGIIGRRFPLPTE